MLLFKGDVADQRMPEVRRVACPPLPIYVEPAPEEVLLSWLLRLATRLGVSLNTLAHQGLGLSHSAACMQWWRHPGPSVIARISDRTGVGAAQVGQMTFERFEPSYRDDEASARFTGRWYETDATRRLHRFALCAPCLESEPRQYLRTEWLVGWVAMCPRHGTILVERCHRCHASVRLAPFSSIAALSPATCQRCGTSVLAEGHFVAHPSVVRIQTALWRGKREGITEIEGLGRLTWQELVALIDVLLGMMWVGVTHAVQHQILQLYTIGIADEPPVGNDTCIYNVRHASLRFLAWLVEGWPDSTGAKVAQELLGCWFNTDRNRLGRHLFVANAECQSAGPPNFESPIRERLRALTSGDRHDKASKIFGAVDSEYWRWISVPARLWTTKERQR